MPGFKQPPDGYVSLARIARRLDVDRRVLKQLYELDRIAGVRADGGLWLERRSLAAYLWSRPRCVRADCGRRVIGDGPGCHAHRRSGRHHSEETKRKISRPRGPVIRVVRWHLCERNGCDQWTDRTRFCSHQCLRAACLNRDSEQLQKGHLQYRDDVERAKAEHGLLDMDELRKRLLRAGVPRSPGAISGHIKKDLLERARDLGFDKPYLFTEAAIDAYIERLRNHRDGRLRRFDEKPAPGEKSFRGKWHEAHGHGTGGYGILNGEKGSRGGRPRGSYKSSTDERDNVRQLAAGGLSQRKIADRTGLSRDQVRLLLSRPGD